jgi:hypothetical protein
MNQSTAPRSMKHETTHQVGSLGVAFLLASLTACGPQEELSATAELSEQTQAVQDDDSRSRPIIGLALEVEDGVPVPLRVRAGQTFYINQIDLRASVAATRDEGVNGLRSVGDFSGLGWGGVRKVDEEFELTPGTEGYKRRRFYRDAAWMDVPSSFTVEPVDAQGRPTGGPINLNVGSNDKSRDDDDFFVRRFRAIQWTYDCVALHDCTGANNFLEEALVELRYARTPGKNKTLTLRPNTAALRVRWSLRPCAQYTIPVEQVANPAYGYGFSLNLTPLTPPRANGTYAPGTDITFRLTLKDGSGNRLHPQGSLPTYNEVAFGANVPGIQYYRAFFDPTATYYRRKHRERMLVMQITGPAQNIQPIRSVLELSEFIGAEDTQHTGTLERDNLYSEVQTFPPANDMFLGNWDAPVSDTGTFHLPANAPAGTYIVTVKGRRTYLGEDIPSSHTFEIQVGTSLHTSAPLTTGPCNSCHSKGGELSNVLHGIDNRATCAGCHGPLSFELEGPIFVRLHFIHSRSDRYGAKKTACNTCHLNNASIQRTSKAACFSCHNINSWSSQHEARFGPLQSMYVGGGRESFQQCTGSCHTTHPQSGL